MAEIGGIKEMDHVVEELEKIAVVKLLQRRSIISLIGNVQKSSLILEKVFKVLRSNGVNVQMISEEWHWHGQQKQLSRVTLEPMLRSVAYISEQLSAPANRVAVINL